MTSYASVLTITAFTIERYIAICKPLQSHKIVTLSRCVKIIVVIWILALCCALAYPIHTDVFYYVVDDQGRPMPDSLQCNIPHQYSARMRHVFQLSTFVFFVFPLTVIIVLYSLIGLRLRRAELNRSGSQGASPSSTNTAGSPRHVDKSRHNDCAQLVSNQRRSTHGHHDRGPAHIARRSVLKVLGQTFYSTIRVIAFTTKTKGNNNKNVFF